MAPRTDRPPIAAIDFDGTICKKKSPFPRIGQPVPGAFDVLLAMQEQNYLLILYTMREGDALAAAINVCSMFGLEFWAVNENPDQQNWAPEARKLYADVLIDDLAIGCPLVHPGGDEKPYVDWDAVGKLLGLDLC